MTQTTAQAIAASQTIAVRHVKISSEWSFAGVHRRLEDTLPKAAASIAEVLRSGDRKLAPETKRTGRGARSQFPQDEPLQLSAALYALLRMVM